MAETWSSIFNLFSKITPMFLAECEGYITDLSIAVKEGSLEVDKLPDPMTKSSVLSPFNLSLFNDIQVSISCRQMMKPSQAKNKSDSHLHRNGSSYHIKFISLGSARRSFLLCRKECKILTTHKKRKQTSLMAGQKHVTFYTLVWARTFDPVNR